MQQEEVAHYKPREETGDKLIMEAGHLSRGLLLNCVQFSPPPPPICFLSLFLAFHQMDLNENQAAGCLPIYPGQSVEEEGQPMEICPKN